MSSENRPGSFLFVPDVKSAEKVLHEHELDTTTSFVTYYNNGLGKGKLKCAVSVFCDFTNYWFVYTKMEYPGAEYCTWHRNRNILTKEVMIVGALGQKKYVQPYKIQRDEESCLHSTCILSTENGYRTLIKSIPGSVQSRNINLQKKMNCESLYICTILY